MADNQVQKLDQVEGCFVEIMVWTMGDPCAHFVGDPASEVETLRFLAKMFPMRQLR